MSSIVYYYTGKFNFLKIITVLSQIKEKHEMKHVFNNYYININRKFLYMKHH